MDRYTAPHVETSALITIDTQNDFSVPGAVAEITDTMEVIPRMVKLLKAYRERNRHIIHLVRLYLPDGSNADICRRHLIESGISIVAPGSHGAELVSELKPDPSVSLKPDILLNGKPQQIGSHEYIFYKPRWGAFYGTDLEAFLKERDIDTLVFTGCNFPNCPRASIYQAGERDFRIIFVKDAVSNTYEKGAQELEKIGVSILNTDEVIRQLIE